MRTLVIESNLIHCKEIVDRLIQDGVEAAGAQCHLEAMELVETGLPELIIMEDLSAWRFAYDVRQKWPNYRPVMVSLYRFNAKIPKVWKALCEEHGVLTATKPFAYSDLLGWVSLAKKEPKTHKLFTNDDLQAAYDSPTKEPTRQTPKAKRKRKTKQGE
jgi:hypothetical protein